MLLPPPTSAETPVTWIEATRNAAAVRDGVALRAHPTLPRIQAQSPTRGWLDLMNQSNGADFATIKDRDLVLGRINSK